MLSSVTFGACSAMNMCNCNSISVKESSQQLTRKEKRLLKPCCGCDETSIHPKIRKYTVNVQSWEVKALCGSCGDAGAHSPFSSLCRGNVLVSTLLRE